jgi:hypothetical protein
MSTYLTGVSLRQVPTGFGGYTGVIIQNSGNFPTQYTINISPTTFDSTVTPAKAANGEIYDTIFISDSLNYLDPNQKQITKVINCNDSGSFYILHSPFRTFNLSTDRSQGEEYATVTINSQSNIGDSDANLLINITGNRITGFPIPKKFGKFYAVKDYSEAEGTTLKSPSLTFYWSCINNLDYYTGFKLELADNSSFTSPYAQYLPVEQNSDGGFPLYGGYNGFYNQTRSVKINNLSFGQNYYARIQAINVTGGTGEYTYATGYDYDYPILDDTTYSGNHPSPGENLKITPTMLYLNYLSNTETNFDLYNYIYVQNGNSADFRKYSGINIKFSPSDNTIGNATYKSSSISKGVINFIPKDNIPMAFNTGENGIFRLELEFENVGLYGYGGEGVKVNTITDYEAAKNGGPIFKFDDVKYNDSSDSLNIRTIQYYIYKDVDSVFYAGIGGGQGLLLTDQTNNGFPIPINGAKIETINYINLKNP